MDHLKVGSFFGILMVMGGAGLAPDTTDVATRLSPDRDVSCYR